MCHPTSFSFLLGHRASATILVAAVAVAVAVGGGGSVAVVAKTFLLLSLLIVVLDHAYDSYLPSVLVLTIRLIPVIASWSQISFSLSAHRCATQLKSRRVDLMPELLLSRLLQPAS